MVVGLVLPGHDFRAEEAATLVDVELTGRTCPWNTCAIWNIDLLALTGFPLVGDGFRNYRKVGGVEEVSAITFLQLLHPHLKAKLVQCSGSDDNSNWETTFSDPVRQQYHDNKMKSKVERPLTQMQAWGDEATKRGKVLHIIDNNL